MNEDLSPSLLLLLLHSSQWLTLKNDITKLPSILIKSILILKFSDRLMKEVFPLTVT